jgi:hypothetical protein
MPRRGENIHKRKDGRWEARFIEFYSPKTRRAHYKSIYARTYREVKEKLKKAFSTNEKQVGTPLKFVSMPLLCAEWLEGVKISLKESTFARYYALITNHISPHFVEHDTRAIDEEAIIAFITAKTNCGRLDGRGGLSPKTVHDIFMLLKQILQYGESKGNIRHLSYNFALPKIEEKQLKTLSLLEEKRLLHHILLTF